MTKCLLHLNFSSYYISPADSGNRGEILWVAQTINNASTRYPNGSGCVEAEQLRLTHRTCAKPSYDYKSFLHLVEIRSRVSITSIAAFWPAAQMVIIRWCEDFFWFTYTSSRVAMVRNDFSGWLGSGVYLIRLLREAKSVTDWISNLFLGSNSLEPTDNQNLTQTDFGT